MGFLSKLFGKEEEKKAANTPKVSVSSAAQEKQTQRLSTSHRNSRHFKVHPRVRAPTGTKGGAPTGIPGAGT